MAEVEFALSVRQPWAALLVHARKVIEVRRWPTVLRGRILIHAGRLPDERPEARVHVTPDLEEAARQLGGIIGAGDLTDCKAYRTVEAFTADQARHLNEPRWFREPVLFGFVFANLTVQPFRAYPGSRRFFAVEPLGGRHG
jgi:hypothetical protein